jgi:purine-binding chemotaxis protein CheW
MSVRQLCTFYLDGHHLGIDVTRVQEVIRQQELTPVPLAPGEIAGLMNLRGQIVSALDLRRRLGIADRPADQPPMNVVVRTAEGSLSLLVDRIGDVLEVHDDDFEPPPDTLQGPLRTLIHGAYKLEHDLLSVLDTDRAIDLATTAA